MTSWDSTTFFGVLFFPFLGERFVVDLLTKGVVAEECDDFTVWTEVKLEFGVNRSFTLVIQHQAYGHHLVIWYCSDTFLLQAECYSSLCRSPDFGGKTKTTHKNRFSLKLHMLNPRQKKFPESLK